jgi:hypothetical protein
MKIAFRGKKNYAPATLNSYLSFEPLYLFAKLVTLLEETANVTFTSGKYTKYSVLSVHP